MMKRVLLIFILVILLFPVVHAEDTDLESPDSFLAKTKRINTAENDIYELANFNLYSYRDHKMVSLNSTLGKVVVLEFWTTWSRHCENEIQPLNELYLKYRKKGLEVLAVALEEKEIVREYLKKYPKIEYNILFGYETMSRDYNLDGMPVIYVLDRKLKIMKKYSGGYIDKRTLEKEIRKLL